MFGHFLDIDECTSGSLCLNGGTCRNTLGSYNCQMFRIRWLPLPDRYISCIVPFQFKVIGLGFIHPDKSHLIFLKKILEDTSPFCGATDAPGFEMSGDIGPGFQSQGGSFTCVFCYLHAMDSSHSPLVQHLLTS